MPSNLPNCKASYKNKNSKIWNQRCPIWVFWGAFLLAKFDAKLKILELGTKNILFGHF